MKLHTRDKEKDRQASVNVKSRIIVIEERIKQQSHEFQELQDKYDLINLEVEKTKQDVCSGSNESNSLDFLLSQKMRPFRESISVIKSTFEYFLRNGVQEFHDISVHGITLSNNAQSNLLCNDIEKSLVDKILVNINIVKELCI